MVFGSRGGLERVRALLTHHAFRISRSESTADVSRQRIRELSRLVAKVSEGYDEKRRPGADSHQREHDEELVSAILGLSHPRVRGHTNKLPVVKRALLEPSPISNRTLGGGNALSRTEPESAQEQRVREIALCIMGSKDSARVKRRYFFKWTQRVKKVSHACLRVRDMFRARRLKLLAQAFGRLSRHSTFQRAVSVAHTQGAATLRMAFALSLLGQAPSPPPARIKPASGIRKAPWDDCIRLEEHQHKERSRLSSMSNLTYRQNAKIRDMQRNPKIGRKLPWENTY